MISYNKLSYHSDAFIDLDNLEPYIDLITNENFSAARLSLEKYTAGTTDNPDDYKLPELNHVLELRTLSEINPFTDNKKSTVLSRIDKTIRDEYDLFEKESKIIPDNEAHLYSPDAQEIMRVLENNFINLLNRKNYDHTKFQIGNRIDKYILFVLNERYFQPNNINNEDKSGELINIPIAEKSQSNNYTNINNESNSINNTNVNQNIDQEIQNILLNNETNTTSNNQYDYSSKSINYKTNVSNKYRAVRFTIQNITQNYITEVKNEIMQEVKQLISVIENKVTNENISKLEINNIKNEIINNFETKIEAHTSKALSQFEAKSKAEIRGMFRDFLNS